jgi:hypothetical protein
LHRQHPAQSCFDKLRRQRGHLARRDQPAESRIAALARQRAGYPRSERRIEFGEEIGRGGRPLGDEEGDDGGLGRSRERLPDVQFLALAKRRIEDIVDFVGRKGPRKQIARLPDIAEQIGARREVGREFFHQTVEGQRLDRPEPRRRACDRAQIRRIEVLQEPGGWRLAHHQEQSCRFLWPAENPLFLDHRLRHDCSIRQAACSRLAPATI